MAKNLRIFKLIKNSKILQEGLSFSITFIESENCYLIHAKAK